MTNQKFKLSITQLTPKEEIKVISLLLLLFFLTENYKKQNNKIDEE